MTTEAESAAAAGEARWLPAGIRAIAVIELLSSLSNLAVVASLSEDDGPPAQWLIFADLALQPLLALVALYHALTGRLRIAIMALAAMAIADLLLKDIPLTAASGGPGAFDDSAYGLVLFVQTFVLPALCVLALVLAWQNRRLMLAGVLAMLPTLAIIGEIVVFAIGVAIRGF